MQSATKVSAKPLSNSNSPLRVLTADEWQSFSEIRLEALENYLGVFSSSYALETTYGEKEWRSWLDHDEGRIFAVFIENNIVGITGIVTRKLDPSGKTGMIFTVYTKPGYRGKGYSTQLYKACIEWGIQHEAWDKIVVSHRADNEASRHVILRHNFMFTHTRPRVWPDGASSEEVWYQLDLAPLRNGNTHAP